MVDLAYVGYDRDTPETRHKGRPIRQCDSLVADPGCDGHEFVLVTDLQT